MQFEPISGRQVPRFAGIRTFFRLPIVDPEADFDWGLVGVPFDGGATYRAGARFGPSRVRDLSALGRVYNWGRHLQYTQKIRVADVGDIPITPIDLQKTYEKIESFFLNAWAKTSGAPSLTSQVKKFISIGGDHSITLPTLRALKKKWGYSVRLIHFDAHLDTYPAAWDCEYHHGSFLRHAINEGLIDTQGSLQIGIRGPFAGQEDLDFVTQHKIRVVNIDEIRDQGLSHFLASLPDFKNDPVYISFDVDCLDPVYAPGTGTPVVGGLTTYEVQRILRALRIQNFVGADVVEVSPPYDSSDLTSLAAVDVLFEMLGIAAQCSEADK